MGQRTYSPDGITIIDLVDVYQRAPTTLDIGKPVGYIWVDEANGGSYQLMRYQSGTPDWQALGGATVAVQSISADSGSASPVAGNITIATDTSLTSSATGSTVTVGLAANNATVQYADVTLTSTEIKALATTPIELVAAPAAGSTILFLGALLKLNYGGTNAFTEAGDNLGIKYTDAAGVQVSGTIESTGFIDQTADTYTNAIPAGDAIVAATGAEAQALVLDNLGSNFAGNAADDNTMTIRVYYEVQAI